MSQRPIPLASRSRRTIQTSSRESLEDDRATPVMQPVPRLQQATVLLSAFLTICLTIGYNQTYGIFLEYYLSKSQTFLSPAPASMSNPPTAQLAFVGTLGAGLTWAGSIFVNPLISRIEYIGAGGPSDSRGSRLRYFWHSLPARLSARHLTLAGVFLMALGFVSASFVRTVSMLLLTQGLLYGVGSSLLYFPLLGPAPEYFTKHRGTAVGLMLSGGGVGGVVLGPIIRTLLSNVGCAWTLRILAGIILVIGGPVAFSVPKSRFASVPTTSESLDASGGVPARRRTHVSLPLATSPAFLLSAIAAFCQAAGAQLPLTFIPSYSVAVGLSAGTGATLLAASNILNAVARIATGYVGDKVGRLNTLAISVVSAFGAVLGLWLTSVMLSNSDGDTTQTEPQVKLWLAFIVIYSIAAGGYYALFPAAIADIFGIRSYAAVNGFIYFVRGCGTMVGSPVGGTLLGGDRTAKGYADVVYWDGALLLGSVVCLLGVRWADALRRGWMWRA